MIARFSPDPRCGRRDRPLRVPCPAIADFTSISCSARRVDSSRRLPVHFDADPTSPTLRARLVVVDLKHQRGARYGSTAARASLDCAPRRVTRCALAAATLQLIKSHHRAISVSGVESESSLRRSISAERITQGVSGHVSGARWHLRRGRPSVRPMAPAHPAAPVFCVHVARARLGRVPAHDLSPRQAQLEIGRVSRFKAAAP